MEQNRREFRLVLLAILLVYALGMLAGLTCPVLALTGVSCPGCGMTRAWLCLLQGRIGDAFRFHPLFPLPALLALLWPFRRRIGEKAWDRLMALLLILVLAVWVLRFFLPDDPAVRFDPGAGLLGRIVGAL